jgi:hypothetical protein
MQTAAGSLARLIRQYVMRKGSNAAVLVSLALMSTLAGCGALSSTAESEHMTFDALSGRWNAHSISLEIDKSGRGILDWRVGVLCQEAPRPCDRLMGNDLVTGGHAEMQMKSFKGDTGTAEVTFTSDEDGLPTGPVRLRMDRDSNMLHLSPFYGEELALCGPDAPHLKCGV